MCLFIAFAILDQPETFQALLDLTNAFFGLNLTAEDVTELGKKVLKMERDFNAAAGFTKAQDRLPEFFKNEALPASQRDLWGHGRGAGSGFQLVVKDHNSPQSPRSAQEKSPPGEVGKGFPCFKIAPPTLG